VPPTDDQLAANAREKQARGESPSHREAQALERNKRLQRDQLRLALIRSVPKKVYCQLTGRQPRTVNDQADKYGVPLRGDSVDLGAVVEWLHDFLAKHGRAIRSQSPDDLLLEGASQELKDEYIRQQIVEKRAKARLAELDLAQRAGELVTAASIHELLTRFASILRRKGEALQRRFGPDAQRIMDEGLDDCDRELDRYFPDAPPAAKKPPAKKKTAKKRTTKKKAAKKKTAHGRKRNTKKRSR